MCPGLKEFLDPPLIRGGANGAVTGWSPEDSEKMKEDKLKGRMVNEQNTQLKKFLSSPNGNISK